MSFLLGVWRFDWEGDGRCFGGGRWGGIVILFGVVVLEDDFAGSIVCIGCTAADGVGWLLILDNGKLQLSTLPLLRLLQLLLDDFNGCNKRGIQCCRRRLVVSRDVRVM